MKAPENLPPELLLAVHTLSRDDMEIALRPLFEHLRMSYEASTKFAEQGIKSGFILNGGALVLLSGFTAVFKVNPTSVVTGLVGAALAFMVGLTASCVTCFFAYRNAKAEMHVATHRIAATTLVHLAKDPENDPLIKNQRDSEHVWLLRARRGFRCAVSFGLASLVAFIAGALLGGYTITMHAGGV
jgi:hypothetical protein